MASSIAERFMRCLQRIEDEGQVDALVELFADDAELSTATRNTPWHGVAAVRRYWNDYRHTFDQVHSTFTAITEMPDRVVLEWITEGTLTGGRPLRYSGASVLELKGDKIAKFRAYYDSAPFRNHGPHGTETQPSQPKVVVSDSSTGS